MTDEDGFGGLRCCVIYVYVSISQEHDFAQYLQVSTGHLPNLELHVVTIFLQKVQLFLKIIVSY